MHPDLSDRLIEAFPHLYRRQEGPEGSAGISMLYAFECRDGWFDLLWWLSAQLEALIAAFPEKEQSKYVPGTIKEKWGTLRVYLWHETPEMQQVIRLAEQQSGRVCEECGAPGSLMSFHGIAMTRCPAHDPARSQHQESGNPG